MRWPSRASAKPLVVGRRDRVAAHEGGEVGELVGERDARHRPRDATPRRGARAAGRSGRPRSVSWKPPRTSPPMTTCGKLIMPGPLDELGPSGRVTCEIDLRVLDAARIQQLLDPAAERARVGRVHGDVVHTFSRVAWPVPSRPRRSSSAPCGTARPIASFTSIPRIAGGWARSPRACAGRRAASAAGSSRSSASTSSSTRAAATCSRSRARRPSRRTPRLRDDGARARRRRPRLRRGRRACSRPPSRTPPSSTCSPTSSRCSSADPAAGRRGRPASRSA